MDNKIYVLMGTTVNMYGESYKKIQKITTNVAIANTLHKIYGWEIKYYDNDTDINIIDACTRYYTVNVKLKNNEMLFSGDMHYYDNRSNIDTEGKFGLWCQENPKTIFDLHQIDYCINIIADNEYDARDMAEKQYLADVKALGIDTKDLYYNA